MRCQRVHCGGLLVGRHVLTEDGRLWEHYCVNCGRATLVRVECVYTPPRLRLSATQEAKLTRMVSSKAPPSSSFQTGLDDSAGISWPTALLDQLAPDTTLGD